METSTGDGLPMVMWSRAMLSNMREAWWIPVGDVPIEDNPLGRILVNGQRTLPHSIMVNRRGRRFTNEAANDNAFGAAFHVEDVSLVLRVRQPASCWLIFDQSYVDTYGFRVRGRRWRWAGAVVGPGGRHAGRAAQALLAWTARSSSARSSAGTRCAPRATIRTSAAATFRWPRKPAPRTARAAGMRAAGLLERGPYYAYEIHSDADGARAARGSIPMPAVLYLDGDPIVGLQRGRATSWVCRSGRPTAGPGAPSGRPWCSATSRDVTPRPVDRAVRRPGAMVPGEGRTSCFVDAVFWFAVPPPAPLPHDHLDDGW